MRMCEVWQNGFCQSYKVDKARELKCNVLIEDSYDNAVHFYMFEFVT